jgi:hypothetical protein
MIRLQKPLFSLFLCGSKKIKKMEHQTKLTLHLLYYNIPIFSNQQQLPLPKPLLELL